MNLNLQPKRKDYKEGLRRLLAWSESVWMELPYEVRCRVNMRDVEHARKLLKEKGR